MAMHIRPSNGVQQLGGLRPASAPPQSASEVSHGVPVPAPRRAAVEGGLRRRLLNNSLVDETDLPDAPPLDLMPQLQRSGPTIVKTRSGSVLSRGVILKTDHYPSGTLYRLLLFGRGNAAVAVTRR